MEPPMRGRVDLGATEHALLGAVVDGPVTGGADQPVVAADQPWLADHVVNRVVLFPRRFEVGDRAVSQVRAHRGLVLAHRW